MARYSDRFRIVYDAFDSVPSRVVSLWLENRMSTCAILCGIGKTLRVGGRLPYRSRTRLYNTLVERACPKTAANYIMALCAVSLYHAIGFLIPPPHTHRVIGRAPLSSSSSSLYTRAPCYDYPRARRNPPACQTDDDDTHIVLLFVNPDFVHTAIISTCLLL